MPVSVNVQTVHPRKLAAVRREVAPGAVGSVWGPALGKVWEFIRSQPGLRADGHNIFLYQHPTQPGAPIVCDFGVEVTRTFETAGEVRDRNPSGRGRRRCSSRLVRPNERRARRDRKMDGGEREGVRWALVGDIRRSDAGSGRHRDDGRVPPKVAFTNRKVRGARRGSRLAWRVLAYSSHRSLERLKTWHA